MVMHAEDHTYSGIGNKDIFIGAKSISIRSENGASDCVIDCEADGIAFWFTSPASAGSVVDGFTILNAKHSSPANRNWAAIECVNVAPIIINNVIKCTYTSGIRCADWENSELVITNNVIEDDDPANHDLDPDNDKYGNEVAGIRVTNQMGNEAGTAGGTIDIEHNTISGIRSKNGYGGGISCQGTEFGGGMLPGLIGGLISHNTISNCRSKGSDYNSGGIFCFFVWGIVIDDNDVFNNQEDSEYYGSGGMLIMYCDKMTVENNRIFGNNTIGYQGLGGGITL